MSDDYDDLAGALRRLDRETTTAERLLAGPPHDALAEEAERHLDEIEALLAELACELEVGDRAVGHLLAVRDELSGHLLAAATLEEIDLPPDAVRGVLRRAVVVVRAGLAELQAADQLVSGRN